MGRAFSLSVFFNFIVLNLYNKSNHHLWFYMEVTYGEEKGGPEIHSSFARLSSFPPQTRNLHLKSNEEQTKIFLTTWNNGFSRTRRDYSEIL